MRQEIKHLLALGKPGSPESRTELVRLRSERSDPLYKKPSGQRPTGATRTCAECKGNLPAIQFPVRTRSNGYKYHDSYCHPCRKLRSVCRNLCLSTDQYRKLIAEAGGACSVCGHTFSAERRAVVDHCHSTGMLRGVLCSTCNAGLGHFKDSAAALEAAAEYCKLWTNRHAAMKPTKLDQRREQFMTKIRDRKRVC